MKKKAKIFALKTTLSTSSDARDKTDIQLINDGLNIIENIKPSKYKWDMRNWYDDGIPDGSKKNNQWNVGFIAQDLEKLQTNNNVEYLNLVNTGDKEHYTINSSNLVPVIVKALQDLSKQNKTLSEQNEHLINEMSDLKSRIANLENK